MPEEREPDFMRTAQRFHVGEQAAGERLDIGLSRVLGASRGVVRKLLAAGAVGVRQEPGASLRRASLSEKGRIVGAAEVVWVQPGVGTPDERASPEPDLGLRVLGRGRGWLAIDKPPGMPVHPLRSGERGTALGFVASLRPEVHGVGEGGLRSGVVHRLDVGTSGAMLFGTEEVEWSRLRSAFARHRVTKTYRALVAGALHRPLQQELGLYVAQHRPARVRVIDVDAVADYPGGRVIAQRVTPVERYPGATLVEVSPVTGFLHQIRATLAHAGHPILGDVVYAPPDVAAEASRPMLHAARVGFEEIEAHAPDASDFGALLDRLAGEPG